MQEDDEEMSSKDLFSLRIQEASIEDILELTEVMTRAFDDDAQRHLGIPKGGPPGYDDGSFLQEMISYENSRCYKALVDDRIVASITVYLDETGNNYLANMFVDPNYHRQGIGSVLIRFIDRAHPETKQWFLDTPKFALSNHRFYEGNGFVKLKEVAAGDDQKPDEAAYSGMILFIYRKVLNQGA
jgi:GNAT superfamily N-acetyltransferase